MLPKRLATGHFNLGHAHELSSTEHKFNMFYVIKLDAFCGSESSDSCSLTNINYAQSTIQWGSE